MITSILIRSALLYMYVDAFLVLQGANILSLDPNCLLPTSIRNYTYVGALELGIWSVQYWSVVRSV